MILHEAEIIRFNPDCVVGDKKSACTAETFGQLIDLLINRKFKCKYFDNHLWSCYFPFSDSI